MDARFLVIDLVEKMCLLATAGLLSVLLPPLRSRVLGVGRPRDEAVGAVFGLMLAMWGGKLGDLWQGYHVSLQPIGILMAAFFAGRRAGLVIGALAGAFYVLRVDPAAGFVPIVSAAVTGYVAGVVNDRPARAFTWVDAVTMAITAQVVGTSVAQLVALLLAPVLDSTAHFPGREFIEATAVAIAVNAAGFALQTAVARVVLQREEHAAALAEARAAAQTMALDALRRRIEPHFLFNALNTLRATIRLDPERARALVLDLADLYRYLLHHPDVAPLAAEVRHATEYLAIESARLGPGRLTVVVDLPSELAALEVPALLLQPLVENAVKHGIAPRRDGGRVTLRAFAEADALVIEVVDEGVGPQLSPSERGTGIALDTLREMLRHRHGAAAALSLVGGDGRTTARVRLPRLRESPP